MSPTDTDTDSPRSIQKSASAFRTISEVAEDLGVPQHVLRFWETKFPQVRPMKRGGGRRYYRPEDIEILRRIHTILHAEGYTIKGAQRLLKQGKTATTEIEEILTVAPAPVAEKASAAKRGEKIAAKDDLFTSAFPVPLRQKLENLLADLKSLRKAVA